MTFAWHTVRFYVCRANLIHLFHITLLAVFGLFNQKTYQASSKHGLVIDPGVNLAKKTSTIAAGTSHQLRNTTGVEVGIRRYVVHLTVKGHPSILAMAACLALKHRGCNAKIGSLAWHAPEVSVGARYTRPVKRGVTRGEQDFAVGLGRPGGVGGRRCEAGGRRRAAIRYGTSSSLSRVGGRKLSEPRRSGGNGGVRRGKSP